MFGSKKKINLELIKELDVGRKLKLIYFEQRKRFSFVNQIKDKF